MRGKSHFRKRQISDDLRYHSPQIAKFVNYIMMGGKKNTATKVLYGALDLIQAKEKEKKALEIFERALDNVGPMVEVRSKRIGGANYQVPMEVTPARRQTLAMRWVITAARHKKGRPMAQKLADELLEAYHEQGVAIKKRDETLRMAEANKAFAHFARM